MYVSNRKAACYILSLIFQVMLRTLLECGNSETGTSLRNQYLSVKTFPIVTSLGSISMGEGKRYYQKEEVVQMQNHRDQHTTNQQDSDDTNWS